MSAVPHPEPLVSPQVLAALLLTARPHLQRFSFPVPTAGQVLAATGAGKTRAYELCAELAAILPTLDRPVGRPAKAPKPPAPDPAPHLLTRQVLTFVMDHPGCITGSGARRVYADVFRRRILELREQHTGLELVDFAKAAGVPLSTIEDWMRVDNAAMGGGPGPEANGPQHNPGQDAGPRTLHIEAILNAFRTWHGPFTAFCDHARHHLRVPYGNKLIATILFAHGERTPRRRPGRTPDEQATRGSFVTFFPGAQWVGDGMQIPVTINDQTFVFNLELNVDADSGAFVGATVRDEEDSQAVVEAFQDGVNTTGQAPLSLLLDNKPCNHTAEVDEALGDTLRIRATLWRAQNKAHVEGSFGLFSQFAPTLDVQAFTMRELARCLLMLVVQTLARVLNHRPRKHRDGKSRVELYREGQPTEEQIAQAQKALQERCKRQQKARQTQRAHADPLVLHALDRAFERLGLLDPEHHIRLAIAGHGRDIALEAIAIFEGKKNAGTLPDSADGRYILGIARNIRHVHEADSITLALIRERIDARDFMLAELQRDSQRLLHEINDVQSMLRVLIERIVQAERNVDQLFWIDVLAQRILNEPPDAHQDLFRRAALRIHATFSMPRMQRQRFERLLARIIWPLD